MNNNLILLISVFSVAANIILIILIVFLLVKLVNKKRSKVSRGRGIVFCSKCGSQYDASLSVCPSCGVRRKKRK